MNKCQIFLELTNVTIELHLSAVRKKGEEYSLQQTAAYTNTYESCLPSLYLSYAVNVIDKIFKFITGASALSNINK